MGIDVLHLESVCFAELDTHVRTARMLRFMTVLFFIGLFDIVSAYPYWIIFGAPWALLAYGIGMAQLLPATVWLQERRKLESLRQQPL
jgi:hypothetical protein